MTKEKKKPKKSDGRKFTRIDGEQRFYDIEGVGKFPSVTTILGVLGKPALIGWAKKQVALAIQPILKDLYDQKISPTDLDVDAIIKMAKQKPQKIMEEAGDIGTQVHRWLEVIVKEKIGTPQLEWEALEKKVEVTTDERVKKCVSAFFKWANKHHFDPLESELMVYSKRFEYAGTFDAIGYVDGILTLIDFKSSKAFYPEMGIQLAAYRHAYQEMTNKKIPALLVLRLGKEDGEFEAVTIKRPANALVAFKSAITLWKWKNKQSA
jgi:hypothetical protein